MPPLLAAEALESLAAKKGAGAAATLASRGAAGLAASKRGATTLKKPTDPMSWGRAMPVLILGIIVDAARFFFELFWFFGPALAALACTAIGSDVISSWTFGLLGTKTAALVCSAGAGVAGFFAAPALVTFGVIMGMAVGFAGWLIVWSILMIINRRILTENTGNMLWLFGSLILSEIPFLDALPALTGTLIKMYSTQIKTEKAAMDAYQAQVAAEQAEEQQMQLMQQQQYMAQMQQEEEFAFAQEQEADLIQESLGADDDAAKSSQYTQASEE